MAFQQIDLDTVQPNGKPGDPARTAFLKVNNNFVDAQSQINALSTGVSGAATSQQLAAEVTARQNADTALQQNINAKADTTVVNTLSSTVTAQGTAIGLRALTSDLNSEVTARQNADTAINNIISTYKSAAKADIVGTITQSGGVPSGAIFESGSNANGAYFKFANGLMICTRTVGPISIGANAVYNSPTYTFAASFVAGPVCLLQMSASFPYLLTGNFESGITSTQYRYSIASRHTGTISDVYASTVAIGRWY